MASYEIRLSARKGQSDAVYRVRRVSDFAAIRNARQIAKDGEVIEVWRGKECIYADQRQALPSLH